MLRAPIDIRGAEKANLPGLQFAYTREPLKYLINNGYTIRANYHGAPGTGNLLTVGDRIYQLVSLSSSQRRAHSGQALRHGDPPDAPVERRKDRRRRSEPSRPAPALCGLVQLHGIANPSALHESVTWFCP